MPSRSLGTTVTYWAYYAQQLLRRSIMPAMAGYAIVHGWGTIPTSPHLRINEGLRFLLHRLFVFSTKLARLSIISGVGPVNGGHHMAV